jgi:hypothetical protein
MRIMIDDRGVKRSCSATITGDELVVLSESDRGGDENLDRGKKGKQRNRKQEMRN